MFCVKVSCWNNDGSTLSSVSELFDLQYLEDLQDHVDLQDLAKILTISEILKILKILKITLYNLLAFSLILGQFWCPGGTFLSLRSNFECPSGRKRCKKKPQGS